MIKGFVSALALAGMLIVNQAAQADPSRGRNEEGSWRPAHADVLHNGEKQKTLKKDVYRTARREEIPLRRLFGLNDYAGYRVETVTVKLKGYAGRGRVRLLVNGRVADTAPLRDDGVLRLRLPDRTVIGRNLKTLRLAVDGNAFIKDIKVRLNRTDTAHRDEEQRPDEERYLFDQRTIEGIARLILRHMEYQRY